MQSIQVPNFVGVGAGPAVQYTQSVPILQSAPMPLLQQAQAQQIFLPPSQQMVTVQQVQQVDTPPDISWIGPSTKYRTQYVTVPIVKPVKKMVKKVETVMVDEKYWDTKWIAVQVPKTVMEDQVVLVDEEILVDQPVEHHREIKIPQKVMERQTVMVPKQRFVMEEPRFVPIGQVPTFIPNSMPMGTPQSFVTYPAPFAI